MVYAIEALTGKLRTARIKKGLSQRAFAKSIGMPQSRLSRIENGITDLQTSNLLELARALDLELVLVPRQALPAVRHLVRQSTSDTPSADMTPLYDLGGEGADDG